MKKNCTFLQNLLSLFYPRLCLNCKTPLHEKEEFFCMECSHNLPETKYHLQESNPLDQIFIGRVSVYNTFSYLFFRKGTSTQAILHALKYRGNKEIGEFLGYRYGQQLRESGVFQDIDLIIPIPLHPRKEKKRGYNQSEWIAKGLSQALGIEYNTTFLFRKTFTDTQTKKARFNRWENVKEVFEIKNCEILEGKHILLCDDVLTTGATMEAAIQQFIGIKDVKISVVTLAVAN